MIDIYFGDSHIEEEALLELEDIFTEILNINADTLNILGDYYNRKHPTPLEIDFGTKWIYKFVKKYKKVNILTGNHEELDEKMSSINYLMYLNANILSEEVVFDNVLLGHFFVDRSSRCFGEFKHKVSDLKKYSLVLLGHDHGFQKITNKMYHLGACRYTSYNEIGDKTKYICLVDKDSDDAGTKYTETFLELKSVIPMVEVFDSSRLDSIDPRTKVRLTLKDFEQFKKEVNNLKKWREKFTKFKIKLDFEQATKDVKNTSSNTVNLKETVNKWLNSIKDEDVKKELKEVFK